MVSESSPLLDVYYMARQGLGLHLYTGIRNERRST
jgi:hypothetical protein